MSLYRIRFNKTRGQPGRGTEDHVWRVFDEQHHEWLVKGVVLLGRVFSEKDPNNADWNFCCEGAMTINRETSTITIKGVDIF
jgi:hypothetical protein